jgi:hypothetical protein
MAWLVVACALLVSTTGMLAAVRFGPGRRDAPRWNTRASRRRDARRLALRLAPALLFGMLLNAFYAFPLLDFEGWLRFVTLAFITTEWALAARAGGLLARRPGRAMSETFAAAAAFSAAALAMAAAWHGRMARLDWMDSLGVHALLWLLLAAVCAAGYWTARLWTAARHVAARGATSGVSPSERDA